MTVGKGYLLDKPSAPAFWKQYLDLTVPPMVIDAAGAMDSLAERAAMRTRERPLITIGLALSFGCGLALLASRRRR